MTDRMISDKTMDTFVRMVDLIISYCWPAKLEEVVGLNQTQYGVLHELCMRDRLNHSQLAKQVSVAKQTMTGISDKLVEMGYVERIHDSNNRRQVLLQITPAGRKAAQEIDGKYRELYRQQVLDKLTDDEKEDFGRATDKVYELMTKALSDTAYSTPRKQYLDVFHACENE